MPLQKLFPGCLCFHTMYVQKRKPIQFSVNWGLLGINCNSNFPQLNLKIRGASSGGFCEWTQHVNNADNRSSFTFVPLLLLTWRVQVEVDGFLCYWMSSDWTINPPSNSTPPRILFGTAFDEWITFREGNCAGPWRLGPFGQVEIHFINLYEGEGKDGFPKNSMRRIRIDKL